WPAGDARSFMIYGWKASDGHTWNNAWMTVPPSGGLAGSPIATGVAGGTDALGEALPVLHLFGGTGINSGFNFDNVCLSCRPPRIGVQPQSQSVVAGMDVQFQVIPVENPVYWFQWYCNEAPLEGATNSVLEVVNAQLSQNGNRYYAIAGNPWGFATSDTVTLTVTTGPPVLIGTLLSQTAEAGSNVRLVVGARGIGPLAYQWNWNSAPVQGGTGPVLELTDVQPALGGSYAVTVTNSYGASTSAVAVLNVIAPVPRTTVPGILLQGQIGTAITVEYKPTMAQPGPWNSRDTVILTNSPQWYFDSSAPPVQGFYRASQPSSFGPSPTVELHMVPALSVTGSIGSSQRLEYINQFGPVDDWQPLAVVFLTNSMQLYFDSSAAGKSPRLYRLLPVQ
ncbi:MAG TPA: immunoglobulin domain-containing protein, partial [Verrucomicrobiae bacterium]|nr:immunoglobulin domain-containing protein [Verrucomicrobiae bacterium]